MQVDKVARQLLALPRTVKRLVALAADSAFCVLAVWIAYGLRLDVWGIISGKEWVPVFVSWVLALPIFVMFGMYREIFRYSGWGALIAIAKATSLYGIVYVLTFTVIQVDGVPRTIGIIQPLLLLTMIGASRITTHYWLGGLYQSRVRQKTIPKALIYGAGAGGRQLAAVLASDKQMTAVGFVDDDPKLQGLTVNGLRVFSPTSLGSIITRLGVTDMLLAIPSASRARRNEILGTLQSLSLRVRTLPGLMDLAHGRIRAEDIRELDIEDLLGRDPVAPNPILLNKNIRGKVVLVTGAGGSIGSELCRQIKRLGPSTLLLVERSEFALYSVRQDLLTLRADENLPAIKIVSLLASVFDHARMDEIMRTWRPDTVYHAAAYKHVPLVEQNPAEGIRNNVLGTFHVARAAAENGVASFVLISTDKAVRPTNIMGASKRLAEMVLQALASSNVYGTMTQFSMVRFGNVLGSSGSVVPLFRQQIKKGGPITVTHADITRYFMTIPEAAQLVIQAGAMASGGDVFVLDMGEPVKIRDLARRMVELCGLTVKDADRPGGDIDIVVTGMRPGEKLYEELLIGDNPEPTLHPRIMKAHEDHLPWPELEERLAALDLALTLNDVGVMRRMLMKLVAGYQPAGEIADWIHLEHLEELMDERIPVEIPVPPAHASADIVNGLTANSTA